MSLEGIGYDEIYGVNSQLSNIGYTAKGSLLGKWDMTLEKGSSVILSALQVLQKKANMFMSKRFSVRSFLKAGWFIRLDLFDELAG